MAGNEFGAKVKIDGEREFREQITNINREMRTLATEMALVSKEFEGNEQSIEGYTAKAKVLQKEIEANAKKAETLEAALKAAGEAEALNSRQGQLWQADLNRTKAAMIDLEHTLEEVNAGVSKQGDYFESAKNQISDINGELQILSTEMALVSKEFEGNGKSVESYTAKARVLQKEIEANAKKIQVLEAALKAAGEAEALNSRQGQQWQMELNRAKTTMIDLERALSETNEEIGKQSSHFDSAEKSAKQYNQSLSTSGNELKKTAVGVNQLVFALKSLALGYAGKTLFTSLIGSNAEFEQGLTSFKVLLGDVAEAEKMMNDLSNFAKVTPFGTQELQKATNLLLGYGVEAESMIQTMSKLGDLSQGNAEKFDRITLAYGQMLAKGKVTGEELRQMTEAQVPMLQALADYLNKTTAEVTEMISSGEVSIADLDGAIAKLTDRGGKFYQMMQEQSKTYEGMMSNLKESIEMFSKDVGNETFEVLKREMQDLLVTIENLQASGELERIAKDLGRDIANVIMHLISLLKTLYEMKEQVIAAGAAFVTFKTAMSIGNVIATAVKAIGALKTALEGAATATLASNAAAAVNPWVLLASGIAAVTVGLIAYHKATREAMYATAETYKILEKVTSLETNRQSEIKAIEDSTTATAAKLDMVEKLAPKLEALAKQTNRTAAEEAEMKAIIDTLNEAIPTLNLQFDTQTGKLNMLTGEILNSAEAFRELTKSMAIKDKMVENQKALIEYENELAKLEAQILKEKEVFEQAFQEGAITNQPTDLFLPKDRQYLSPSYFDEMESKKQSLIDSIQEIKGEVESLEESFTGSFEEITEAAESTVETIENVAKSFDLLKEQNKSLEDTVTAIQKVKKEIAEYGQISTDSLDMILEKYPHLIAYIHDVGRLNEELAKEEEKLNDQRAENYTEMINQKLSDDTEFYNALLRSNSQLVEEINRFYDVDLSNFSSLAQAKESIESELLSRLSNKWSEYYKLSADAAGKYQLQIDSELQKIAGSRGPAGYMAKDVIEQINEMAYADLNKLNGISDKFKELSNSFAKKTLSYDFSTKPKSVGGGSGSSGSQKQTGSEDTAKELEKAIQEEIDILKWHRDMEQITEAEYYRKLAEIRDAYFEEGTDKWRQYTLEIKNYNDKATAEAYNADVQNSYNWIADREFYGDWDTYADNAIEAWQRVRDKVEKYYEDNTIDHQTYAAKVREIDKNIFTAEKKLYDSLKKEAESYVSKLKDIRAAALDNAKQVLNAKIKEIEDELSAMRNGIDQKIAELSRKERDLQDSWTIADRKQGLDDLYAREREFQGAVTIDGQAELKRIQDEIKRIERETEMYELQKQNAALIEQWEAEYKEKQDAVNQQIEQWNAEYKQLEEESQRIIEQWEAEYKKLEEAKQEQLQALVTGQQQMTDKMLGSLQKLVDTVSSISLNDLAGGTIGALQNTINNQETTTYYENNPTVINHNTISENVEADILSRTLGIKFR